MGYVVYPWGISKLLVYLVSIDNLISMGHCYGVLTYSMRVHLCSLCYEHNIFLGDDL
jgi:hypothetical protein